MLNADLAKLPRFNSLSLALHVARLHAVLSVLNDARVEAAVRQDAKRLMTAVQANGQVAVQVGGDPPGCTTEVDGCFAPSYGIGTSCGQ